MDFVLLREIDMELGAQQQYSTTYEWELPCKKKIDTAKVYITKCMVQKKSSQKNLILIFL